MKTFADQSYATREQKLAFIRDLQLLSEKHGLFIHGDGACGCCGAQSPNLREVRSDDAARIYRIENDHSTYDAITFR